MGKLTAAEVRAISTPGKYYDQHGLVLRVAPGGSKQWIWRGTVRGRVRDIGLGAVTYTTLADARDTAYEYRKLARSGGDPATLRRVSDTPTFTEAVEMVIASHRGGWKDGGRSETNWRSSLERYARPAIGHLGVDEITTADLVHVLQPLWHTKRETARKLRTRLGVVLRWAVAQGYRVDDPTAALGAALPKNGTAVRHHASLPAADLAAALARLDASTRVGRPTAACLRFIAATACRSGEARLATWGEIDLNTKTWTVPGGRTKTGTVHVVPLSPVALAALDEARGYADTSGLCFPSPTGRALSSNALSQFTGREGFTPHGMRSSFRSWAAETGVAREVAEMCLGHAVKGIERAYQRSDLLERRRAVMADWGAVFAPAVSAR